MCPNSTASFPRFAKETSAPLRRVMRLPLGSRVVGSSFSNGLTSIRDDHYPVVTIVIIVKVPNLGDRAALNGNVRETAAAIIMSAAFRTTVAGVCLICSRFFIKPCRPQASILEGLSPLIAQGHPSGQYCGMLRSATKYRPNGSN